MRICVVGAGAIGGVLASRLAAVADVSVLARGATLAAIRGGGLRVVTPAGDETVTPLAASDDAAELGAQDFVIVAVKAQAMAGRRRGGRAAARAVDRRAVHAERRAVVVPRRVRRPGGRRVTWTALTRAVPSRPCSRRPG